VADSSVVVVRKERYDYSVPKFKPQGKISLSWSPNLSYAIGLIAADGNLSPDGRHFYFVSSDQELVKNLKGALELKNKITRNARGGEKEKKYFVLQFGDSRFYKFLNQMGITAAKSKTIKRVDIPDKYFGHFIRGLFDGDGTFYTFWDTRWPNSFCYQTSFASASPDFLEWLKSRLTDIYSVRGFVCRGAGVYNLRYVKGDSLKLFLAMYPPYRNMLFLSRKYNKMNRALRFDGRM
jgi:hypothetical protein